MQSNPYLYYPGTCAEAFHFYEEAIGAKVIMMINHEGTPMEGEVPEGWVKKILHADLQLGKTLLMGSDAPPQMYRKPQGFSINLKAETPEEADRLYSGLAEGGTVHMPYGETFWAKRFGMFTDRYGIPWMVSCDKSMPSQ